MEMKIDDSIWNGNGKEWESPCTGMGMALIPIGINSHREMQCLSYVLLLSDDFFSGCISLLVV